MPEEKYLNYKFMEEAKITEIDSIGQILIHEKSGARVVLVENEDDNKVFSIVFRTPPEDSTGLPHILEHSVLCGSRKFPSKEPFVELAKGSLNTFLNAMTFPDKTMYPVASKNEKDFFNLMDVYLDAVFFPNIYKYPEIFKQEGWHYEIIQEGSPRLEISGVVYNEMKGAYSTPEELLFRKVQETLYPDTPYANDSGGDPDKIPELTYDRFINFHKKYYHPSNSYIYVYGNVDRKKLLDFLDKEYLSKFNKEDINSSIPIQGPIGTLQEYEYLYPISKEESEIDKTYFSLNFSIGTAIDPVLSMAFTIIEYLLLETPASPLKSALIKEGIGKDVFGTFESSLLQPHLSIVVKNSNIDKKDSFKKIVFDTLNSLVEKGIDKKLIEASINILEFKLREADYRGLPKGLVYHIKMMESWLYDHDPFIHLRYENHLKEVKRALKENYFEDLIKKYLLQSNHSTLITIKPDKNILEEKEKRLREKLDSYFNSLTDEEKEKIKDETDKLKLRQITPDPPEILEKIPILSIDDIDKKAEELPIEVDNEKRITLLYHHIFTSGIAYFNMFFDSTAVPQENIPYISLLSQVLTKLSTKNFSYGDLSNEININTGGIRFSSDAFGDKENDSIYYPKLVVKSKALINKFSNLQQILKEIIFYTEFKEKGRLREVIQEARSRLEMSIYELGHNVASNRLLSYFSSFGKYMEVLNGLSYYWFIRDIEENYDSKFDEISEKLIDTSARIFNFDNMMLSITSDRKDIDKLSNQIRKFIIEFPSKGYSKNTYNFKLKADNEGLMTPGNVQYVAKGYNYKRLGYEYNGGLIVLRTIASLDYLWNLVRVQGGAYGSFARFGRNGNMYFCSYRDPNLEETLKVYDETHEYLRKFNPTSREMTKYIIGTISKLDHPLTPSMKGEVATTRFISGVSYDDVQKERDEVLSTDVKTIRNFADVIRDTMKNGYYCVLGNENKISANKKMFGKLIKVFK